MKNILRTKLLVNDVIGILSKIDPGARVLLGSDEELNNLYTDIFFKYDKDNGEVVIFGWGNAEQETYKEIKDSMFLPTQEYSAEFYINKDELN